MSNTVNDTFCAQILNEEPILDGTGYATNLMATMQESLKASSGIDVKELLENLSGKRNIRQSIDDLSTELTKSE